MLSLLLGCGGGTSGTGGGFDITGTLKNSNGTPLAGVQVSVAAVGKSSAAGTARLNALKNSTLDVTDGLGQFLLALDQRPIRVTLRLLGAALNKDVLIDNVPPTARGVRVQLGYDEENDELTEEDEIFEHEDGEETRNERD